MGHGEIQDQREIKEVQSQESVAYWTGAALVVGGIKDDKTLQIPHVTVICNELYHLQISSIILYQSIIPLQKSTPTQKVLNFGNLIFNKINSLSFIMTAITATANMCVSALLKVLYIIK